MWILKRIFKLVVLVWQSLSISSIMLVELMLRFCTTQRQFGKSEKRAFVSALNILGEKWLFIFQKYNCLENKDLMRCSFKGGKTQISNMTYLTSAASNCETLKWRTDVWFGICLKRALLIGLAVSSVKKSTVSLYITWVLIYKGCCGCSLYLC